MEGLPFDLSKNMTALALISFLFLFPSAELSNCSDRDPDRRALVSWRWRLLLLAAERWALIAGRYAGSPDDAQAPGTGRFARHAQCPVDRS